MNDNHSVVFILRFCPRLTIGSYRRSHGTVPQVIDFGISILLSRESPKMKHTNMLEGLASVVLSGSYSRLVASHCTTTDRSFDRL